MGASKSISWSHEIDRVAVTSPWRSSSGRHAVDTSPERIDLGHELVGSVLAPLVERAQQHRLAACGRPRSPGGARRAGSRPAGSAIARVGARWSDRAGGRPGRGRRAPRLAALASSTRGIWSWMTASTSSTVPAAASAWATSAVRPITRAARRVAGVVGLGPAEEQEEAADQQHRQRGQRPRQRVVGAAAVLDHELPRATGDVEHPGGAARTARRRSPRGPRRRRGGVKRLPAGRLRQGGLGEVGAGVDGGEEPDVGVPPLGLVSSGAPGAVERLHQEVGDGAVARGAHRLGEHRAPAVARFDGGGAADRVGEDVEAEHGAGRRRSSGYTASTGKYTRAVGGGDELTVAPIDDRVGPSSLLEVGAVLRR